MGVKTTLICGYKDSYLECSQDLYWFSKVAVVGSSLKFMTQLYLYVQGSFVNIYVCVLFSHSAHGSQKGHLSPWN